METLFDRCMRIIRRAVDTSECAVSERQYRLIVKCIRYMATLPEIHPTAKKRIMEKYGMTEGYNPFEDPPRIRFYMTFAHDDDDELQKYLNDFAVARQEHDWSSLPMNTVPERVSSPDHVRKSSDGITI